MTSAIPPSRIAVEVRQKAADLPVSREISMRCAPGITSAVSSSRRADALVATERL